MVNDYQYCHYDENRARHDERQQRQDQLKKVKGAETVGKVHVNKWTHTEFSMTADGNGDWYNPCKAPFDGVHKCNTTSRCKFTQMHTYVDPNIRSQHHHSNSHKIRNNSKVGWIITMGYIHTMELYSARKVNERLPHTTTWMCLTCKC